MASLYERLIGAPMITAFCGAGFSTRYRERVVPRARGEVLELGIGSCLNLPVYTGAEVRRVTGVDPSARMRELGAQRIAAAPFSVDCIGLAGEEIDLPAESVDTVVVTFSLCTIPDPVRALKAAKRVLKPGGELLFLEHGRSPDAGVADLGDALDVGSSIARCGGSSPFARTRIAPLKSAAIRPASTG